VRVLRFPWIKDGAPTISIELRAGTIRLELIVAGVAVLVDVDGPVADSAELTRRCVILRRRFPRGDIGRCHNHPDPGMAWDISAD
jgi:hypothetical protein